MSRRKLKDKESLLSHSIVVRLTTVQYEKLDTLAKESDSKTIAEVVRNIISNRPIKLLHKDISMNAPMEELALIRKEIKSIGVNINQQTHRFHAGTNEIEKSFHFIKTAETYSTLEPKVDQLLTLISKLAVKWLQE